MSDDFLTGLVIGALIGAVLLDLFNLLTRKWGSDD